MVGVGTPSDSHDFGSGLQSVGFQRLFGGQNQDPRSFGHDKTLPVHAERPGGLGRVAMGPVVGMDLDGRVHIGETVEDLRDDRHIDSSGQGEIAVAVADHPSAQGQGVIRGSARALG